MIVSLFFSTGDKALFKKTNTRFELDMALVFQKSRALFSIILFSLHVCHAGVRVLQNCG
jgi:hypothetical protein